MTHNRGTRVRLLGKMVMQYHNGVLWHNPDTGRKEHLGDNLEAAAVELERLLGGRPRKRLHKPAELSYMSEAVYRAHWRAYYYASARAKRAGSEIMGRGDFERIMTRAGGRCELTGIAFTINREAKGAKALWGPSLDRIKCHLPYSYANCRLVCTAVNLALNEFGLETLQKIALALTEKQAAPTA